MAEMETETLPDFEKGNEDEYLESIEFLNSCRQFYLNRVKVSETHKEQLQKYEQKERENENICKRQSSMGTAMETLRKEMTSLMDQDLSLMEQLLTLNETIEDLKSKRLNTTLHQSASSCDLTGSEESISDTLNGNQTESCSFQYSGIQTFEENKESESVPECSYLTSNTSEEDSNWYKTNVIFHKSQFSHDSGYEESGSDVDYTGTTL